MENPAPTNLINIYLLYTCYLFKLKLFNNCKFNVNIRLKNKTNNDSALAMRKDFKHEKMYHAAASIYIKKSLWPLFMAPSTH